MARKAFVHIGTHKTGTTYLQNWLRRNRHVLTGLNLAYPIRGLTEHDAAHKQLSLEARTSDGRLGANGEWQRLAQFLRRNKHDVILSSETFSDKITTASAPHRIVEFFEASGMETIFVVLLRDVPAYMNSRYVQDVKNFRSRVGFKDYVAAMRGSRVFDYPRLLQPFEDAGRVIVQPYLPQGEALERRFLTALGLPESATDGHPIAPIARQNRSVGPVTVALAREITGDLPDDLSATELTFKRALFKRLCNEAGFNEKPFVGCDQDTAETIRVAFAAKTDAVAGRYFDHPWPEAVPAEPMFDRYSPSDLIPDLSGPAATAIRERIVLASPGVRFWVRRYWDAIARRLQT